MEIKHTPDKETGPKPTLDEVSIKPAQDCSRSTSWELGKVKLSLTPTKSKIRSYKLPASRRLDLSRNRTDDFNLHSWPTDGSSTVAVDHQINVEYRVLLLRVECGKGLDTPHY